MAGWLVLELVEQIVFPKWNTTWNTAHINLVNAFAERSIVSEGSLATEALVFEERFTTVPMKVGFISACIRGAHISTAGETDYVAENSATTAQHRQRPAVRNRRLKRCK